MDESHFITEASSKIVARTEKLNLKEVQFIKAPHVHGGGFVNNSLLIRNGKKYRVRVETLIYNDRGQILATKRDKISKYGLWYNLPGGSIEPNKTIEEQAAAEAREEVFARVEDIKQTGIWFINKYPKASLNPNAWDYDLAVKYGLDYDGAITIVCVGKYVGRYGGKINEADKVDWGNKAKFYDPDAIKLAPVHRKALSTVEFNTNESWYGGDTMNNTHFVTEGKEPINWNGSQKAAIYAEFRKVFEKSKYRKNLILIGRGLSFNLIDSPIFAFMHTRPGFDGDKDDISKICKEASRASKKYNFSRMKIGSPQISHFISDKHPFAAPFPNLMYGIAAIPKNSKPLPEFESHTHFVTVGEEENHPLMNPYNSHGNIKTTRRVDHDKAIKHPSTIKKYVNSNEAYNDFF